MFLTDLLMVDISLPNHVVGKFERLSRLKPGLSFLSASGQKNIPPLNSAPFWSFIQSCPFCCARWSLRTALLELKKISPTRSSSSTTRTFRKANLSRSITPRDAPFQKSGSSPYPAPTTRKSTGTSTIARLPNRSETIFRKPSSGPLIKQQSKGSPRTRSDILFLSVVSP